VTEDFVDCDVHGRSLPAFVCVHLLDGDGLGFYHSDLARAAVADGRAASVSAFVADAIEERGR